MRAAQEGHLDVMKVLVQNGADVNKVNDDRMSALMLASQRGHAPVVQYLVEQKADYDAATENNSTALMLACKRDNKDVVEILLAAGCELMMKDSRHRTARDIAEGRSSADLVKMLDPQYQIEAIRRKCKRTRDVQFVQLYTLLQDERAYVRLQDGSHVTIHRVARNATYLDRLGRSRAALIRTMTLPAPIAGHIATYLALPHCWQQRSQVILKRSQVDANSAVSCALDLVDEVLEEGGFLEACDTANIEAPTGFSTWVSMSYTYVKLSRSQADLCAAGGMETVGKATRLEGCSKPTAPCYRCVLDVTGYAPL